VPMDRSLVSLLFSRLFHSAIPAGIGSLVLKAGTRAFLRHRETARS